MVLYLTDANGYTQDAKAIPRVPAHRCTLFIFPILFWIIEKYFFSIELNQSMHSKDCSCLFKQSHIHLFNYTFIIVDIALSTDFVEILKAYLLLAGSCTSN